jgi:hypothetical protein
MDVDQRTFRNLLQRGELVDLFNGKLPTASEFIARQALVQNPLVLRLVAQDCLNHRSP